MKVSEKFCDQFLGKILSVNWVFGFIFGLLLGLPCVYANDTTAVISSEEISFIANPDISLEEEVLKISEDKIEVEYLFKNHSDKEVTSQIAFPLPAAPTIHAEGSVFPRWDESYYAAQFLENNPGGFAEGSQEKIEAERQHSNFRNLTLGQMLRDAPFINFSRKVEGQEYGFNYRVIAKTKEGRDITSLLKQNNIPLSATYLIGFEEEGAIQKDPALKAKLKNLKLLDEKDKPIWQNQTIYYWEQKFPPNKTIKVSHQYRPQVGQFWLDTKKPIQNLGDIEFYSRDLEKKEWKNYCVNEKLKTELIDFIRKNKMMPVKEIDYILTTANNWRGSIKKFRLEIHPSEGSNDLAFCWPGKVDKTDQGIYVSELKDFRPKQELKILFPIFMHQGS